jgi:hypothetical protein
LLIGQSQTSQGTHCRICRTLASLGEDRSNPASSKIWIMFLAGAAIVPHGPRRELIIQKLVNCIAGLAGTCLLFRSDTGYVGWGVRSLWTIRALQYRIHVVYNVYNVVYNGIYNSCLGARRIIDSNPTSLVSSPVISYSARSSSSLGQGVYTTVHFRTV